MKAEIARRSLHRFLIDYAWPVLQPSTPFADNWHIHAICEHLEAVHHGQIKRLIINMPFRLLKSTIVSQAFPAWEWIDNPSLQFLTASYAMDLATRDAVDCRRIIESVEYQAAYGDRFSMTTDQNVKTRYENSKRGSRVVTATDAKGTGYGGNRIIIDDPISSKDSNSDNARNTAIEWYRGTVSTRLNDPANDALIIVHQRLHRLDLSGYILAEEEGWEQLILPMRYEKIHVLVTGLGFKDPRTEEGELLCPARLPEPIVAGMEKTLGKFHTSAQLQQRPTTRGGSVLQSAWFPKYTVLPRLLKRRIYADTAQKTKERNDYSVFQLWGLGDNGKIYLIDQIRGKWEAYDLETQAVAFWNKHKETPTFGAALSRMAVEDKSSGTGLIQSLRKKKSIPIFAIQRNKDKLIRCYDGQGYMEAGLVCLPEQASFLSNLMEEVDAFTKDDTHAHDDQIDPMLDAIEDLLSSGKSIYEML